MWSDTETKVDYLNFLEVAEVVCDVLLDPEMRPVSIGVFGTWGTGKSSLLNLIEADLRLRGKDDVIDEKHRVGSLGDTGGTLRHA